MEQALARIAAILAETMPTFDDDYGHRRWDAAQFRVHGLTAFDRACDWQTSQSMRIYSAGRIVEQAIQARQVRPGYEGNIAEPRRAQMLEHAARIYAQGKTADDAIDATCAAFPRH